MIIIIGVNIVLSSRLLTDLRYRRQPSAGCRLPHAVNPQANLVKQRQDIVYGVAVHLPDILRKFIIGNQVGGKFLLHILLRPVFPSIVCRSAIQLSCSFRASASVSSGGNSSTSCPGVSLRRRVHSSRLQISKIRSRLPNIGILQVVAEALPVRILQFPVGVGSALRLVVTFVDTSGKFFHILEKWPGSFSLSDRISERRMSDRVVADTVTPPGKILSRTSS